MKNPMTFSNRTFRNMAHPKEPAECALFEQMLTDALDGTLTEVDQRWFDRHTLTCAACALMLADAQRGAAWLGVLKQTRPEPSGNLLARILAQTSEAQASEAQPSSGIHAGGTAVPPAEPGWVPTWQQLPPAATLAIRSTNLLQFPAARRSGNVLTRLFAEPRLAMTAAMAFFSIALTMNLLGVHLNELHARDLSPASLRRGFFQAQAGAVRGYDSLHVVQVLESRVDDLRDADSRNAQPESATPAQTPPDQTPPDQPPAKLERELTQPPRLVPGSLRVISRNHAAPAAPADFSAHALLAADTHFSSRDVAAGISSLGGI